MPDTHVADPATNISEDMMKETIARINAEGKIAPIVVDNTPGENDPSKESGESLENNRSLDMIASDDNTCTQLRLDSVVTINSEQSESRPKDFESAMTAALLELEEKKEESFVEDEVVESQVDEQESFPRVIPEPSAESEGVTCEETKESEQAESVIPKPEESKVANEVSPAEEEGEKKQEISDSKQNVVEVAVDADIATKGVDAKSSPAADDRAKEESLEIREPTPDVDHAENSHQPSIDEKDPKAESEKDKVEEKLVAQTAETSITPKATKVEENEKIEKDESSEPKPKPEEAKPAEEEIEKAEKGESSETKPESEEAKQAEEEIELAEKDESSEPQPEPEEAKQAEETAKTISENKESSEEETTESKSSAEPVTVDENSAPEEESNSVPEPVLSTEKMELSPSPPGPSEAKETQPDTEKGITATSSEPKAGDKEPTEESTPEPVKAVTETAIQEEAAPASSGADVVDKADSPTPEQADVPVASYETLDSDKPTAPVVQLAAATTDDMTTSDASEPVPVKEKTIKTVQFDEDTIVHKSKNESFEKNSAGAIGTFSCGSFCGQMSDVEDSTSPTAADKGDSEAEKSSTETSEVQSPDPAAPVVLDALNQGTQEGEVVTEEESPYKENDKLREKKSDVDVVVAATGEKESAVAVDQAATSSLADRKPADLAPINLSVGSFEVQRNMSCTAVITCGAMEKPLAFYNPLSPSHDPIVEAREAAEKEEAERLQEYGKAHNHKVEECNEGQSSSSKEGMPEKPEISAEAVGGAAPYPGMKTLTS
jgi:hypothetical protein